MIVLKYEIGDLVSCKDFNIYLGIVTEIYPFGNNYLILSLIDEVSIYDNKKYNWREINAYQLSPPNTDNKKVKCALKIKNNFMYDVEFVDIETLEYGFKYNIDFSYLHIISHMWYNIYGG